MSELTVAIVTHDHARVLPACLDSVRRQSGGLDADVVVVDSGSRDGVEDVARRAGAEFLPGPNRGYAAACNRAIAALGSRRPRYVLFLNPDAELSRGTLAELVALCDARPLCGVFGLAQVDERGLVVPTIGRAPTPADYWRTFRTGWGDWVWEEDAYGAERRCDWVSGGAMVVRGEVLSELRGFDERFFLYSEEVDLCTTARRAGWDVAYLPQVTAIHRVGARPFDPHRERMVEWSKLLYIRKWHGTASRLAMRAALAAFHLRHLARRVGRGEPALGERVRLGASLRFRPDRYGPARKVTA